MLVEGIVGGDVEAGRLGHEPLGEVHLLQAVPLPTFAQRPVASVHDRCLWSVDLDIRGQNSTDGDHGGLASSVVAGDDGGVAVLDTPPNIGSALSGHQQVGKGSLMRRTSLTSGLPRSWPPS